MSHVREFLEYRKELQFQFKAQWEVPALNTPYRHAGSETIRGELS
jgi:hypothetical protein